ncbi:MAG: HAMP domain-containing protein [Alphaproteobacteria bacterium]|nr:HAMP domain-containing protein [Alphaproteobacteria bacterium]
MDASALRRRLLPRSLFGRSLLIIVMPLLVVQIVSTWFFYDRHWDVVARRLAQAIAGDVAAVVEMHERARNDVERNEVALLALRHMDLRVDWRPGQRLPPIDRAPDDFFIAGQLYAALRERVDRPVAIDPESRPRQVEILVELADGVLEVMAPQKRLFTSTAYLIILWTIGSSLVLFAVASLFMRNQVKPIRRLAAAAESFGKGRDVPGFKPEGATEVRQAAAAFLVMRERIQRQIAQRTTMLAGVSHDLRTPLTRMKLGLALLPQSADTADLQGDITEMERMIQGYLDFTRGAGDETPVDTDLGHLLEEVAAGARRDGVEIALATQGAMVLPVRPNALKRCIGNLAANAARHGKRVWIGAIRRGRSIDIVVDDDGPGVPEAERENVFRPFYRVDQSRNPATGGVGLGLTIARDVARGHGGDLLLETSPQGGLRARVTLPL